MRNSVLINLVVGKTSANNERAAKKGRQPKGVACVLQNLIGTGSGGTKVVADSE